MLRSNSKFWKIRVLLAKRCCRIMLLLLRMLMSVFLGGRSWENHRWQRASLQPCYWFCGCTPILRLLRDDEKIIKQVRFCLWESQFWDAFLDIFSSTFSMLFGDFWGHFSRLFCCSFFRAFLVYFPEHFFWCIFLSKIFVRKFSKKIPPKKCP